MQSIFSSILDAAAAKSERYRNNPELSEFLLVDGVDAIRGRVVRSVIIHGSKNVAEGYVHWRLYFQLCVAVDQVEESVEESVKESVEFNSQKRIVGGITNLFITKRNYRVSTRVEKMGEYDIPFARKDVTVQDVIDIVLGPSKARDRYMLNERGSGCRYWCKTVIGDLEENRIIAEGSSDLLEDFFLGLNRDHGNQWIPYPMHQGTFY
ncbi:hypothetical protein J132_03325 [Termitomyces sp. J132]|nr:hypothetical protein J132_03325 [Termitomyces sp. J132]